MNASLFATLSLVALAASFISQSFSHVPGDPNNTSVDLPGTLELVDKPPAATPVEAFSVGVRELHGGHQFSAQPDSAGQFVLTNVPPGRYSLVLTFPGRIRVFETGSTPLMPD